MHAEPDHHETHDHHGPFLAIVYVRQLAVLFMRNLAEENALVRPQEVAGGENHARGTPGSPLPVNLVGAEKYEELANEAVHQRQSERGQHREQEKRRVFWHGCCQAAKLDDFEGVPSLVKHADQKKQRPGRNSVRQHYVHRALHADQREGEDAEHGESHVAHGRVRHQSLEIWLNHGHERAVNDADNRQCGDVGRRSVRRVGEERQTETHDAIGTGFQKDARKVHRSCRWRLGMCVGQPRVKRKERHFDGKGHEEGQEEKHFGACAQHQLPALNKLLNHYKIEAAGLVVQPNDAHQHEDRTGHGVKQELDGGVEPSFVPPNANQKCQRNQLEFPEKEEKKQVERKKDADHARFEKQEHDVKFLDPVLDIVPGRQDAYGRQQRNEVDQENADAVDSEVIVNAWGRYPRSEHLQLEAGGTGRYRPDGQERKQKLGYTDRQAQPAYPDVVIAAQNQNRGCAKERKEEQDRQDCAAHSHQRTTPNKAGCRIGQKIIAKTTSAPTRTHTA